jgi:hypothetical protein
MPDAPAVFRRHLARHNRHVLLVTAWSLTAVLTAWALVYFAIYWLVLLVLTLGNPFGAVAPASFPLHFGLFGALFIGLVYLERRARPHRRLRDKSTPLELTMDILLALPNATLTSVENLQAIQILAERERGHAWALLERLREIRQLAITELPLEIPEERTRLRVVRALQFLDLVELRDRDGVWLLVLRGTEAARLTDKRFRLKRGAL